MPKCVQCQKTFASRQSLSNHKKNIHGKAGESTLKKEELSLIDMLSKKHGKNTQEEPTKEELANKVINSLLKDDKPLMDDESESEEELEQVSDVSPKSKSLQEYSDVESDENETESKSENEDQKLLKVFNDLHSKFDDDDEVHNDLLILLKEMKERQCITNDEYEKLKTDLQRKIQLNLYETIMSTTEDMIRNDKFQILQLLRGMKRDERVMKAMDLCKKYFGGEDVFEEIVRILPTLDNNLGALQIKVILNQIRKTKYRVQQVLTRLINSTERSFVLQRLKSEGLLTDEEYEKLSISPNTLGSISKIVRGKGLYLRKSQK